MGLLDYPFRFPTVETVGYSCVAAPEGAAAKPAQYQKAHAAWWSVRLAYVIQVVACLCSHPCGDLELSFENPSTKVLG
jgi:hypothetical protein